MTSNIGNEIVKQYILGFSGEPAKEEEAQMKSKVLGALKNHFKPEFLNRVDEIIVFDNLTKDDLAQIIELQLNQVQKRLAEKKIKIKVSSRAKSFLAKKGFDPNYGARPLKRLIQQAILDKIAKEIVAGKILEGAQVLVDADENEIMIKA